MSEPDKKIELNLAVTGADQAATEVRKLEMANAALAERAKQAEIAASTGFGGMLDAVPERADAIAEAFKKIDDVAVPLSDRLGEVADKVADVGEEARKTEQAVRDNDLNLRGKAEGWMRFGESMKSYGSAMRTVAADTDQLSASTRKLIGDLGGAAEAAGGFLSATANGFATGGPLGAIIGAATSGVIQMGKAWLDVNAELDKAKTSITNAAEMQRKLTAMKARLPLADAAAEASALLDEVYQKALRNERVRESERSLEQTETAEAGRAGVASGAITQQQADARDLVKEFTLDVERTVSEVENTKTQVAAMRGKAEAMTQEANLAAAAGEDQTAKLAEAKKLQDDANQLATKLEDDQKIANNKLQELSSKADGAAAEIGDAGLKGITEAVTKEREALKAEVERLGANSSSGARAALQILDDILSDGKVSAEEVAKFSAAQGRLNGMVETNNKEVLAHLNEGQQLVKAFSTELGNLRRDLRTIEERYREQVGSMR